MKKIAPYILLHVIIMIFSIAGVCSKTAASKEFLSPGWLLFYGLVLLIMAVYALAWQQVLKRMPLNVAYPNKAAAVIWGMIWGVTMFGETINIGGLIGAGLILAGIVLMSTGSSGDAKETHNE